MENKGITVIGAAAVLMSGAATAAPAVADPIPAAQTYADLLQPVSDAAARLGADDAAQQNAPARLILAQYGGPVAHHHHHHHNARWYRQHGYYWNGRTWVLRPRHHHHHHHHDGY